jgi:hypothetical protein
MTVDPAAQYTCPDAVIVSVHQERSYRGTIAIVNVVCPWCGRVHTHGVGDPAHPTLGHRVSHCTTSDRIAPAIRSYVLTDPNGLLP